MSRHQPWIIACLVLVVVTSAISVVYAKYLSRSYFFQLEALRLEREQLDVDWRRLQLEESAVATHSQVEHKAHTVLKMRLPNIDEVVVVRR
ncbi:MAG: cell division protein FtsL [Candidatus Polarisedimenticolaceae bacterium]|nr:cell division protein FtsL [Candidatus Polarisedimenticolaceae bacterium]